MAGGSEEEQGSGCCVQTAPRDRSDLSLPAASQTSGRASLQHVPRRLCQLPFFFPLRNSWSSSGLPSDACSFSSNSAFSSLLSLLFFHTLFLLIQLLGFFLEAISFLPFSSSPSPIFQLCLISPEPEGTPSFI